MRPVSIMSIMRAVPMRRGRRTAPSPASTTGLRASGRAAKNASMPNTVGSSMALRFSGRARKRMAISPRRSALSDRSNSTSKPPADLLTAILAALILRSVTFLRKPVKRSHDFVDVEMDRTPLARPGSERQDSVEPGQRRGGALEAHHGAEIVARRLDRLAAAERRNDFGRTVAQAVAV